MEINCCVDKQLENIMWQRKARGWRLNKVK